MVRTTTSTPTTGWTRFSRTRCVRSTTPALPGGIGDAQFYASFGYLNNKGIIKQSDYERYTARLKADYQAKKWLKVGGNFSYAHSNGNTTAEDGSSSSSGNVFAAATQVAPIYPLYIRDGQGNIMTDAKQLYNVRLR